MRYLIHILLFTLFATEVFSQSSDTSKKYLNILAQEKIFLINKSRKPHISEKEKSQAKKDIEAINRQLEDIYLNKWKALSKQANEQNIKNHRVDSADRNSDFEFAKILTTEYYACEAGSWNIGLGINPIHKKNITTPIYFILQKQLSEKISIGVNIGHSTEQIKIGAYETKDKSYYNTSVRNYTYSNYFALLDFGYHFFSPSKPLFGLKPLLFDPYIAVKLGYSAPLQPTPFLNNLPHEQKTKLGGVCYGIYPALRVYADERLNFSVEAGYGKLGYLGINAGVRLMRMKEKKVVVKPAAPAPTKPGYKKK